MSKDYTDQQMTNEELREAIEQNDFLKLNLRIMNGLELLDKEGAEEPDYNKLAQNIIIKEKKISQVEYTPESMSFYYGLISNGYDCFGEDYMIKLVSEYPEYACLIIHLFMSYAEHMTTYLENLEDTDKSSKDEQK